MESSENVLPSVIVRIAPGKLHRDVRGRTHNGIDDFTRRDVINQKVFISWLEAVDSDAETQRLRPILGFRPYSGWTLIDYSTNRCGFVERSGFASQSPSPGGRESCKTANVFVIVLLGH